MPAPDESFFIVHSCAKQEFEVDATTQTGRPVKALVTGVVVEMLPEDGYHGTVTRRYLPDDDDTIDTLVEKYSIGARIIMHTARAAEQPKPRTEPRPETVKTVRAEETESHAPQSGNVSVAGGATRTS